MLDPNTDQGMELPEWLSPFAQTAAGLQSPSSANLQPPLPQPLVQHLLQQAAFGMAQQRQQAQVVQALQAKARRGRQAPPPQLVKAMQQALSLRRPRPGAAPQGLALFASPRLR